MVQTVLKLDKALLFEKITALHERFQIDQDEQTAERAKDLAVKLKNQEYSIAFCGHFSAGKSSMINKIVGEHLLPSSPIPTSANLVKVKSGEDYAKVIFKAGKPRIYAAPYDYEKVKSYAKDGDQIQSVEISVSNTKLPKNIVIMDTPGIDSTDDAHRIATESALHLADLVFYVMDYNHVQSELNFLFTKELTAEGKQVYLIINQIDKHRDDELSFSDFKKSVVDSFASWGVKPERIFYTTLKDETHKENQFNELQSFIAEKMANREALLPESVFHSLKKLSKEHLTFFEERNWAEAEKFEEVLKDVPAEERAHLPEKLARANHELKEIKASIDKAEIELHKKIDEVLKSAYLMPFSTRDLAKDYLESRQSGFKVGLFFSKQKTEQERQARLERFYADLGEKVQSQIDWHLKELYLNELKQHEIHDADILTKAQGFHVSITTELLSENVKEGALLSGDYVLQYTNDVSESVKKAAKASLQELKELFLNALKLKNQAAEAKIEKERQELASLTQAWEGLLSLKDQINEIKTKAENILSGNFPHEQYAEKISALLAETEEEAEIIYNSANESESEEKEAHNEEAKEDLSDGKTHRSEQRPVAEIVKKLNRTAELVHDVPGFKKMAADLLSKAERLENKHFTVALFGAFSAGKSSFANALIGDKLLPVSPNPTTAAINKIMPTDDQHPHGTVLVKVKPSNTLFEDVNRSLRVFDMSARDFDEANKQIEQIISGNLNVESNEKTHLAFLQAFFKGFEHFRSRLGDTIETDLKEFKDYVALEEKSCFVELIEVYYDCELTRKGITLVDTPGADSINARHTGVAFEYIKNSDAILFVTYYNHAFSKADREFLIQLGRVKDSFELDKMFFIVNAIDLANNEEEKESVLDYVGSQLVQYGIRKPNLFGLSSLEALTEKLEQKSNGTSNIAVFEKSFYSFITNELMEITIDAAELEWKRILEQLRSFIQSSQEDKELKAQKRLHLENEQHMMHAAIDKQDQKIFTQRLDQEADELVFYIKQRVFLRYSEFVKEAFNPALLKDDGRNLKKALQTALEEFLQSFGYDFAQELRATTLRLETFIGKLLKQAQEMIAKAAEEINPEVSFSHFEAESMEGLEFETAFVNEDQAKFKKPLSHFKNPKSFFEKNERKYLMDDLEELMKDPADAYLQTEGARMKDHYQSLLLAEYARMITILKEQTDEYYSGILAVLSENFPIEELMKKEKEISAL